MNFKTLINNYLNILNCSANELAKHSNISSSILSRYRAGIRLPKLNGEKVQNIIKGIVEIACEKRIPNITIENVTEEFSKVLDDNNFDLLTLKENLNILIDCLHINISELSRYLGYDPSYISKIRSGIRKPAYINIFIDKLCNYVITTYNDQNSKNKICELITTKEKNITNNNDLLNSLKKWMLFSQKKRKNVVNSFLKEVDIFNLDEYIKVIHFDELKVPTIPIKLPKSKNYYGLEEMKQGELDFLKNTVLSKNNGNLFMCSDMQMDDMAKDIKWSKKWMFGLAMVIKKGIHINIIHNLDRPFNEMMLGLESWIPMYMTGQVSPFYFKNNPSKIFSQLNYVSKDYALFGECINGFHNEGKYYLTNNSKEIEYYKKKSQTLLNKAYPAMEIYTQKETKQFQNFLKNDTKTIGERKRILATLPIETISKQLLIKILNRNNITNDEYEKIIIYYKNAKKSFDTITKTNILTDEIQLLQEKEFNKSKINLSLDNCFLQREIFYNFDEYVSHYKQTIKTGKNNNNYKILINKNQCFKNIDIYINKNNYVIISKKNNPNINFVIKHEKLMNAIENFIPPVIEK